MKIMKNYEFETKIKENRKDIWHGIENINKFIENQKKIIQINFQEDSVQ